MGAASWSRFSPTSVTPRPGEEVDVARREALRDGDEGDGVVAPGRGEGLVDAAADRGEAGGELVAAVGHDALATTPAKRPVVPERR